MNLVKIKRLITRVCIASILLSVWMLPAGGQPASATVEQIVKVAAAEEFTLALTNMGNVWVWGSDSPNGWGQRYGGAKPFLLPITDVADIDAGRDNAYLLLEDQTVWAWGANNSGEVGDGTTDTRLSPVKVQQGNETGITGELSNVVQIAAGYSHALALKADGTVWVWGYNGSERLSGVSGVYQIEYARPVEADGSTLGNIKEIAAGNLFSLAVSNSNELYSWGNDYSGQLANGYGETDSSLALKIEGYSPEHIYTSAFGEHAFMKTTVTGDVYGWGSNYSKEINPSLGTKIYTPEILSTISALNPIDIKAGEGHTLILAADGTVWGLGANNIGQLAEKASGSTLAQLSPAILNGIVSIEAGSEASFAVKSDGTVFAFGYNEEFKLGTATYREIITTPTPVASLNSHGVTVKGRILNTTTNQGAQGVPLILSHSVYGDQFEVTDADGYYEFENVIPDAVEKHELSIDTYDSDFRGDWHEFAVAEDPVQTLPDYYAEPKWVPTKLSFTDEDTSSTTISGEAEWAGDSTVLNKAVYKVYFESTTGEKLALAGTSNYSELDDNYPAVVPIVGATVPSDAAYLRLYITSLDPDEDCNGVECKTPARTLLLNGPKNFPQNLKFETIGSDLKVSWDKALDESPFAQYELVRFSTMDGFYSESIFGTYAKGLASHSYTFTGYGGDTQFFLRVKDSMGVASGVIPLGVTAGPDESEEPGETQGPKMIRFIDENDEAGIIEGTVIFEAMSTPAEYQIVLLDQNNNWVVTLKSVAEVTGTVRVVVPASSLTPEAKRIGVMADEDDTTLSTLAIWDSSGLKQMDTDPNADELGGELRWSAFPTDSRIAAYKAYIVDMDADTAGVPITGAITHLSEKTVSIPANTSIPADADKIAIVGLTAGGEPISWSAIDIADMGPVEMSIGIYQSKLKAWISPEDPFDMVDVISFGARKKYDITGDGSFNTEDFKLLLKLIDPVYPMLVY